MTAQRMNYLTTQELAEKTKHDARIYDLHLSDYQVREDKGFYIPDMISDKRNLPDMEIFDAASEHAVHLTEAERLVGDAMHLVRMMAEALGQEGDRRAEQTNVACNAIEKKLSKAYNRIDKHDRRHTNLFLAYFDLKEISEEKGQD